MLARRIQRTKVKGTGTRKPSSPETEPNFYLMPYVGVERKQEPGVTVSMKRNIVDPTACISLHSLFPTALSVSLGQDPKLSSVLDPRSLMNTTYTPSQASLETNSLASLLGPVGLGNDNPTFYASSKPVIQSYTENTERIGAVRTSTVQSNETDALTNYEAILSMMVHRPVANSNIGTSHQG